MGVISWIIAGLVAGWLAGMLMGVTETRDRVVNMVTGAIGAVLGGFVTNLVMRLPVFDFSWASLFVALLAAFVFLAVINMVRRT